jgi:DNA invertase Pin-like site-specific DNA recombinase
MVLATLVILTCHTITARKQLSTPEGDTLHIHSIDRLVRSQDNLLKLITEWNNDDITVRFQKRG